jgi:hypothetical protein
MMVILKIPVVYVCLVVYWAIRAEPRPPEGAALRVAADPDRPAPRWSRRPGRRLGPGPHGSPSRAPARTRPGVARASSSR